MASAHIRLATPEDAPALLAVFAPYVEHTAISWETEVPSVEEFRARIERIGARYPYFAAERDGHIVGYAYASPFIGRRAYVWSAELTIYLAPSEQGRGTGRALYQALEDVLRDMHITNLYACIGVPEVDDEYVTHNSMQFHAHLGFSHVGTHHKCGRMFGRWYSMIWMEKVIAPHLDDQPDVIPYPELLRIAQEG